MSVWNLYQWRLDLNFFRRSLPNVVQTSTSIWNPYQKDHRKDPKAQLRPSPSADICQRPHSLPQNQGLKLQLTQEPTRIWKISALEERCHCRASQCLNSAACTALRPYCCLVARGTRQNHKEFGKSTLSKINGNFEWIDALILPRTWPSALTSFHQGTRQNYQIVEKCTPSRNITIFEIFDALILPRTCPVALTSFH